MGMNAPKVLVVEDNPLNMKLVRTLLQLGKYQVIEAANALNGIQKAKEEMPDLILMDIQLPDMDGLSATRLIKKDPSTEAIPVIAITAYAMHGDDQKALDAGCLGYITKPIDTKSFLETISRHLTNKDNTKQKELSPSRDNRHKLLIVDDEPLNFKLLDAHLSHEEYIIIRASSGQDALEKVDEELPDLVLLDIMMPGIDGYEVTKKLKASPKTRQIPIILITSLSGTDDKAKGMAAGADEFLNKPVNKTELSARIRSLLRLKEYQEQLTSRNKAKESLFTPSGSKAAVEPKKDTPVVLLVEDNDKDVRLFTAHLTGQPYRIKHIRTGEEAVYMCHKEKVDLILLDVLLPGMNGFDVCQQLKENDKTRNIQVLIATSLSDLESKIKGIELGADDFLIKPIHKDELTVRVRALLRKKSYMDRLSTKYETALYAAITDKLTGLYNQAYFKHYLNFEIKRCNRQNQTLALLLIDIDDFKLVNDTFGHLAGDQLLEDLAEIIKKNIREIDLAVRYGGEAFAIVLPYVDKPHTQGVAERIRAVISAQKFRDTSNETDKAVTVSMGIAIYPEHAKTVRDLINNADKALYCAKKEGKNRVCTY
jgi:two-component system, cell cycle response regulator